jgi:hypothetical protein
MVTELKIFQPTDRFNISEEVLSQEVNGETVLLNLEGESYFGLNEVGTRIWQLLQVEQSVADMMSTLTDEYDVSREQLENDVNDLLGKLTDAGLVVRKT